jgi:hypothetical protein
MTDLRAVAQQALEALEERYVGALRDKAMDDLRAALAQQEQEPVAFYVYEWVNPSDGYVFRSFRPEEHHMGRNPDRVIPVPPRREWKSLSDAEVQAIHQSLCNTVGSDYRTIARAIEAALKEKNA